jgi:hypothetical protein
MELNLDEYIRKIPDFPKRGILFYDITNILATPKAFAWCIDTMKRLYRDQRIDAVAAIEARGYTHFHNRPQPWSGTDIKFKVGIDLYGGSNPENKEISDATRTYNGQGISGIALGNVDLTRA